MDLNKIIQIVHHLLDRNGYRLNYTKLVKLLYLADREAWSRWDMAITKDRYASLPQGPVLIDLYDLIKGSFADRFAQTQWNSFFIKDGYDLVALHHHQLPVDELSPREMELLHEIENRYRSWDFGKLIDLLHDRTKFPEWTDPGESALPLPPQDILRALGRSEEEIRQILDDEDTYRAEEEYLQKCCV